jgi:glycosyltransferase involved in cell wall biosynthesis
MTGISIIIPTYNRAEILRKTLDSLVHLSVPSGVKVEIIVIENNCTDHSARVFEEFSRRSGISSRRINETRQGHCHVRNRGFAEASFDHVVFFDDDIEAFSDWIPGYLKAVGDLQADCVVGPVFPLFEREVPGYLTRNMLNELCSPYSRKGEKQILLEPSVAHEVPGCNFGVRKEVALQIGGFDPGIGRKPGTTTMLSGDDFDFGERLVEAGKRVVYEPSCAIRHLISVEKLSKAYLRQRWYGEGATQRIFDAAKGIRFPPMRRLRLILGLMRLAATLPFSWLSGQKGSTFECELRTRKAAGYIFGARKTSLSLQQPPHSKGQT